MRLTMSRQSSRALLLAAVLCGGAGACLAQRASVKLFAQVELAGAGYTLGDVSAIDSADALLAYRLAQTRLGVTPRMGYSETVQRRRIVAVVERSDPALRGALSWSGAEAVTVRGRGQEIGAHVLIEAAKQALVDALAPVSASIEVQPAGQLSNLRAPGDSVRISARAPDKPVPSRRMCVWVDVRIDGNDYRSVPVWFRVKATRPAWVARVPLRAGEPLRAADFAAEPIDLTEFESAPVPTTERIEQLRLRHPLNAGRPLLAAHVEQRPAVARNQSVEVKLVSGSIQLETAGIALGDARVGEVVKVRNPANNQSFGATVVADGKVLIQAR
jgi:flagella basal body P-ring formation protein FlgA